ncbi:MAG: phosphoglucosamine mutase [Clostridia bacterium]|nr:phosphoglucosamine mutase [Clostridia bacterium]
MTIGEKITRLRQTADMSQEELAEKLCVSRQSISKWETDGALPQAEKLIPLCDALGVSADALLRESCGIPNEGAVRKRNKYFGTDGFRGEANVSLTSMHAYRIGRFLGWYYAQTAQAGARPGHRPRIVIGKDTRRSSYMFEYSVVAGITASGADAYMLHVTTTPSVSYVTRQDEFDCGIMITASHNPFRDNGIKLMGGYGEKLDDETTALVEAYLDGDLRALGVEGEDLPLAQGERIGRIVDYASGRNRYVAYLISLAAHSYKKLRIGLDCANGSSWMIAGAVFSALGAQIEVIGAEPDGLNVNKECGSTHIEGLRRLVQDKHLDLGFAFDGDADRCLAVDEKGNVVDGDGILYILAKRMSARGMLNKNTVVATVMSNSGFFASLERAGMKCVQTPVGDRFVYECMQNKGYSLGGEQSGHIIMKKYATTGDGLLTAIMLTEEVLDTKSTLSQLAEPVKLYPQYIRNVRVTDKEGAVRHPAVLEELCAVERCIDGRGRVLLRPSGTEPVIRVMVECEDEGRCVEYADRIAEAIVREGFSFE